MSTTIDDFWGKDDGICVNCGKAKALLGKSLCGDCEKKLAHGSAADPAFWTEEEEQQQA